MMIIEFYAARGIEVASCQRATPRFRLALNHTNETSAIDITIANQCSGMEMFKSLPINTKAYDINEGKPIKLFSQFGAGLQRTKS